ncbi:MAG: cob(I)yrinic acid a c-diamide adenosyltransferase [Pseudanabaena sp.]|nr:MAG: cob(I)yrinic acid a c-diamide adenosyltransferase [Pseudanabaena sp.]
MAAQFTKTEINVKSHPQPTTLVKQIQGNVQVFIAPQRLLYADIFAQGLRVAGQGTKVLLVQLFQTGINQGLQNPRRLVENLEWLRCEAQRDLSREDIELTDAEKSSVLELWEYTKSAIAKATASLIIIDEINLLIKRSLVTEQELLEILEKRASKVNIILTGSSMPTAIADYADQITHRRN